MKILYVAGFGPITKNIDSKKFYKEVLNIPFLEESNGYLHTNKIDGVKHFALWPLLGAAKSCFDIDQWPEEIQAPNAWLEFEVEDIEQSTKELLAKGLKLLVKNKKEPWGQIVTRFLSPEGLLIAITSSVGDM